MLVTKGVAPGETFLTTDFSRIRQTKEQGKLVLLGHDAMLYYVLQLDVVASQERELQPAIAMFTDVRLKDFSADSILPIGGERKGKEGTLAPSASKRRIRDLIWRALSCRASAKGSRCHLVGHVRGLDLSSDSIPGGS